MTIVGRDRVGIVPEPATVLGFVALVAAIFLLGGIPLQVRLGESGLLAAQWLLLFAPAALFVGLGGFDVGRTLSLRLPSAHGLLGGVVLIAGAAPLVWVIGWLQTFVLPIPRELHEGLQELVTAETPTRLVWLLLILAVTPAICEEIVFRGVLLGGTRRLEPWRLVLLNGVVFGAFHLSFETVFRFLPTATLGIVIAWAVWRTGSVWVGALMHFLNNATIVVFASTPNLRGALSAPEAPPPLWLVPLGMIAASVGVHVLSSEPLPTRNDDRPRISVGRDPSRVHGDGRDDRE